MLATACLLILFVASGASQPGTATFGCRKACRSVATLAGLKYYRSNSFWLIIACMALR